MSQDVRQMFQEAAARFGGRTAVRSGSQCTSFADLDAETDRLAAGLAARGLGKGAPVAILAERTLDVVTAILGVLKAGGLFVPLDPHTPEKRLRMFLEVAAPKGFITSADREAEISARWAGGAEPVLALAEGRWNAAAEAAGTWTLAELEPDDPCYIYFTSGSTGVPKGIVGRFRSIAHYIRWEIEALGVEEGWNVSQLISPSFDAFLRDMFVPLCAGGTICAPKERDLILDTQWLGDWIEQEEIHLIHTVPSLFRAFTSVRPQGGSFPALRYVLLAGEPLLPADVKRWNETCGTSRLVNLYGPSETTMTKLVYFVEPSDADRRAIPIGKPMPGSRALVINDQGRPCPPRAVGEIYIRTPYRSLGYHNRPDLTREVFLPNPFNDDPKDLVYKTGDLGRVREDGNFEFLGRRDDQVKIRGVRIQLAEIEDLLLRHPAVSEAAVVDREDENGTKFLCAYVVPAADVGSSELRSFLSGYLPDHSLPAAFVSLESLPRTLTGKVDRRSLPAPERLRAPRERGTAAPRSLLEEVVAGIFTRVLGLDRIGVEESFFELGGHSLLATQLLSRLRSTFRVEVPLRVLFAEPTIAGLSRTVQRLLRDGDRGQVPPLAPVPRDRPLELSHAQERLWFLDRLQPGAATYNVPLAVRFQGVLSPPSLAGAVAGIVRRHEALRTTFAEVAGRPVQLVSGSWSPAVALVDLRGLSGQVRAAEADRLVNEEARRPFDLERGPLLRLALLRLGEEEHLGLLTLHHIVSDAWSLGIFVRELAALYGAAAGSIPSPLPELPVQYADFAAWQRRSLTGEVLEREVGYWKERLAATDDALDLPSDRPRQPRASFRGGRRWLHLSEEAAAAVRALSRQHEVTPFMVLLAVFQLLLYSYTGRLRMRTGTPIANRNRSETEGLIGFFVNTLVLCGDLEGEPVFQDLLARIRETALDAYAHQDAPFEKLVEELRPERDLSRAPLFQLMFVFQNAPMPVLELPGLRLAAVETQTGATKFDLTATVLDEPGRLPVAFDYAADLFDAVTVERMLGHFANLLTAALADPGRPIVELPLLAPAEVGQALIEWNDTRRDFGPRDLGLSRLVEEQVERTPGAAAVTYEGETLTYAELNRRANRLARWLRARGVGPEAAVGLCVEPSLEAVVGVLGILKAGGAYVPLDPAGPHDRLALMAEDAGVSCIVLPGHLANRVPAGADRVLLEDSGAGAAILPDESPLLGGEPGNLAYILYTSGSTGRPKGVAVEHRQVLNYCFAILEKLRPEPGASFAMVQPLTVDSCVTVLFPSLLSGGHLHVIARERVLDACALADYFERHRIDCLKIAPSHLAALGTAASPERLMPRRWLIIGGEASRRDWAHGLQRLAPECAVFNHYGPTEATVGMLMHPVAGDSGTSLSANLPLGRPLANTRAFLVDGWLDPVPLGAPGELCIGGACVARGYVGRPELTAERFRPDPFSGEPGARLYRTGDLARQRPDGAVEFLGRTDRQVKIRGFRIELEEVEGAIARHPAVADAVVQDWEESPGVRRLVAYVVPVGGSFSPAELRDSLRERLPEAMIPSGFVVLDALPRTPHGKVDRRALPAYTGEDWDAEGFAAPGSAVEEMLAGIWAEVLGVTAVSTSDDFFAAGGHSLLAIQMVSRVREAFRVELPLRDIFESPKLADLAQGIEAALRAGAGLRPTQPVEPLPRGGEVPLSFAQQRLWFLDQLEPGSPAYNVPWALDLRGELRVPALRAALAEICRRHEVLRATVVPLDGRPWQRIGPPRPVEAREVDLSGLAAEVRSREARRLAQEEAGRPFRLDRGPLLRASLIRLEEREHLLLTTLHHFVTDGWSAQIFYRELATLYEAFCSGRPSPFPELPVQYADFAQWQRQRLQGETLATELGYWRERLRGAPAVLSLPADRPRPAVRTWRGARLQDELPEEIAQVLYRLSRRQGATLFMTLLAAFQALLHRYSGEEDLCVGTPVAGRDRLEIEGLIGLFVNTLVLRSSLVGEPDVCELLARVRESVLQAQVHQALPFEKLVDELQPERSLSHSPLFQVMFVFQNVPRKALRVEGLEVSPLATESGAAKFDLTLTAWEEGGRLALALEYATELFDAASATRILEHLRELLRGMADDPERRVADLPLLTAAERHQLLVAWNDTAVSRPDGPCVHDLVCARAEQMPEAVALESSSGERVTYRELGVRSRRLARRLLSLGVGPDMPVGLCVARSPDLVSGALGILEAGGALLPLDPTYPEERLTFMMRDSGAPVLVTRRDLMPSLPAGARAVYLDEPGEPGDGEGEPLRHAAPDLDNLAYLIYTSGSTGAPKGTMVSHRGLLHYLCWSAQAYAGGEGRGAPLASPIGFDLTITSLFTPLLTGRAITLIAEKEGPEGLTLALRRESDFSFVKLTPAHLELVNRGLSPAEAAGRTRALILGGEALAGESLAFWREHAPSTRLLNEYGPTEAVVGCCVYEVPPGGLAAGPVPIGRPIPGVRLHALDRRLTPVPVGVPGELYISGHGLARGYLGRPDLTAERFVPDPFSGPGERLYRTGDIVRHRPDGNLDFLGRVDHQMKVRGYRIEPGEIEAALASHPGLREVAVVAREDVPGDRRLVAYAVAEPGQRPATSELRAFLEHRLPAPMVPSAFVLLEALPLTAHGKVDRRALPAPGLARPELAQSYASPRTSAEKVLAAIWSQVLRLESVGVHDNFFHLGGDSILSLQIVSRAHQAGLQITVKQMFEHQTVAELAAVAGLPRTAEAQQEPVTGEVPLTPVQRWFFEQDLPDPHHYNQAVLLEVHRRLDPCHLSGAVAQLLRHHDALRLRFEREGSTWRQSVAAPGEEEPLAWLDLTGLPEASRVEALLRGITDLQASLDLSRGPLLRVALFQLAPGGPDRLLLAIHHLAVDGVSWRILLEDLETAYGQIERGGPPELPAKTCSFKLWAETLLQHASSEEVRCELPYWTAVVGSRAPRLPVDMPGGRSTAASIRSVGVTLSQEVTRALLQEVPQVYRTRINDALLTALAQAFAEWTGETTLLVDLEGHGRELSGLDSSRTVGWFTSISPVLLILEDPYAPGEALMSIKEQLRAIPAQGIGYGLLRHISEEPGAGARLEPELPPQVVFNYLGQLETASGTGPFQVAPESPGPLRSLRQPSRYLLEISGAVVEGRLQMGFSYSENVYRRSTIEALADGFASALRSLTEHCRTPEAGGVTPSDFPLAGLSRDQLSRAIAQVQQAKG